MLYLFLFLIFVNIFILKFHDKFSNILNIYDKPDNQIKLHHSNVALLGGPIIFLNLAILFFFLIIDSNQTTSFFDKNFYELNIYSLFFISSFFFLIGLYDDKFEIRPIKKIFLFIFLIILSIFFERNLILENINLFQKIIVLDSFLLSTLFTVFCFLAFINAFNFFDGINLQVGLYSVFIILIFISKDLFIVYWITFLIAILTYIILNFKNKVFLGDSGTLFISFIFSYFFIIYHNKFNLFSADEIFLIMFLPGVDMVRLFIQRLISKKNPLFGDREHIHHLILKKFKISIAPFISLSVCILPYLLNLIFNSPFIIILISIILYTLIFLKLKKV